MILSASLSRVQHGLFSLLAVASRRAPSKNAVIRPIAPPDAPSTTIPSFMSTIIDTIDTTLGWGGVIQKPTRYSGSPIHILNSPEDFGIAYTEVIDPTAWSLWDDNNPTKLFIDALDQMQTRRDAAHILLQDGKAAALQAVHDNLALIPKMKDFLDSTLNAIVQRELDRLLDENSQVLATLDDDIATSQTARAKTLYLVSIPEDDENFESSASKVTLPPPAPEAALEHSPIDSSRCLHYDPEEELPDVKVFLPDWSTAPATTTSTPSFSPASSAWCASYDPEEELPDVEVFFPGWPRPAPTPRSFSPLSPAGNKWWSDYDPDEELPDVETFLPGWSKPPPTPRSFPPLSPAGNKWWSDYDPDEELPDVEIFLPGWSRTPPPALERHLPKLGLATSTSRRRSRRKTNKPRL